MGSSHTVSGTKLITLLDASLIKPGHPIRIIWKGLKDLGQGKSMKDFDVLVAQGDAVPFESLPEISTETRRTPPAPAAPKPVAALKPVVVAPPPPPPKVVVPPTVGTLREQVLRYVENNPGVTGRRIEADPVFANIAETGRSVGTSARALLSSLFFEGFLRRDKVEGIYAYWLKEAA
jgi:hypothetical protein